VKGVVIGSLRPINFADDDAEEEEEALLLDQEHAMASKNLMQ
jgi:hypothetical protein